MGICADSRKALLTPSLGSDFVEWMGLIPPLALEGGHMTKAWPNRTFYFLVMIIGSVTKLDQ